MRQPPGQEPQEESHLGTQASDRHDTPRGSMPGHQYLATPKLCTPLTTAGRTPRGRGGEAEMYPMWENMRYPMIFGRGIPPEGGPRPLPWAPQVLRLSPFRCAGGGAPAWAGASFRFPRSPPESTSRRARRPRMGGGLFSLPRGHHRNRLQVGHGAPACAGASFRFPRSPPASTSGRTGAASRCPRQASGLFTAAGSAAAPRPG